MATYEVLYLGNPIGTYDLSGKNLLSDVQELLKKKKLKINEDMTVEVIDHIVLITYIPIYG